MEKEKIRISFLITHYNRPLDLLQCLQGIKKLNISNYEIVVSDDGSDEGNRKIIEEYKIDKLILSTNNQGLAANINKGLVACEGEYVIYCQEDFILDAKISSILPEFLELLDSQKADMIRFTANYKFNKLVNLSENVSSIPKFAIKNLLLNYYQYSDHPFITKKSFYDKYGNYLENTSGRFGETEYAIRIFKSNAKIAITKSILATSVAGSTSVLINESISKSKEYKINKRVIKIARALRLYLEWFLYQKSKRGLKTYKNFREN